jgi:hypothetical protein
MAYARENFRSKKALREAIAAGRTVEVYQPGPFGPSVKDGTAHLEGPHYPEAHKWYAQVQVRDGAIIPGSKVK